MGLSIFIFCASAYGEVINLGEKNIYSETGFEKNLRNSTTSPYIITSKDIETKGYTSVSEILDSVPGVNVQEGLRPAVDVRGQGFQKAKATVQLLVDGVPANMLDTSHMNVPIDVVNINEIERIEVIPGGGAVLYGSGTSGGVINIITKKYKGNNNVRGGVGYQLASFRNNKFDVSAGTSVGDFDFDINYSKNRKYGYRDYDFTNSDYFSGRINYNINKTSNIAFKYSGYRDKYTYPNFLDQKELDENRRQSGIDKEAKENNRIKKDEFTLTYNTKIGDKNDLNILGFYQKTDIPSESIEDYTSEYKGMLAGQTAKLRKALRDPRLSARARVAMQNRLNALLAELGSTNNVDLKKFSQFKDTKKAIKIKDKFTYDSVGSNVIVGLGYTNNDMLRVSKTDLVGKRTMADTKLDLSKKTFEVFALNTFKVNRFEFIQGLRFENSKYDGTRKNNDVALDIKKSKDDWAGSLAVNYLYSDTGNAYVKYERAFTSPAPGQLVDKIEIAPRVYTYKVNNLKSESTNLFEVGWNDYLFGSLLSADVFYSETKDEIATIFDVGGHGFGFKNTNIGKTKRYGFDLSAEQKFEKFTFKEAYSFIETKILKDNSNSFEGKHIADVPKHKLVFSVDYDITSKFTVGADYEYRAAAFIDNANKYGKDKAKSVFNLRANYKITNSLNVYAGINNIFGAKYYNSVRGNSPWRKILCPTSKINYYAGFKYKF
ncbi:Hemin receptor [Fusobacterium nucleatum subsp. nucleatum ATCC 25586]|uniref:Hemin receptor n=1 Tax=Fusobacterium nucleatum subsp. nucleatum (strain ATCC 25586 / DSM 15643 / BCRC 10681 / CIP 101130 / JCM 8532 / KCTC 2640 / LMG 13131 / VPI 4355) TaxID=190304 RepID=Q8RFD8_FUSNN|nr:Hemin receptor [Fusobacterium nucleatum subsp. nucleatum ATCC 25586]